MKDFEQQIEQGLRDMPEIPFSESLRWDILEAAHALGAPQAADGRHQSKRGRWRGKWQSFGVSAAGLGVAAAVVAGILVNHHAPQPAATMATIPADEIGLKPAQGLQVVGQPTYDDTGTYPTIYATVKNTSNQPISKTQAYSVMWLGKSDNPLKGWSLVLADGPTEAAGGPLQPGHTATWNFQLTVDRAKQAILMNPPHVKFFVAGQSGHQMQEPVVAWKRAPITSEFISRTVTGDPNSLQYVRVVYKITNTGSKPLSINDFWGIDCFPDHNRPIHNWDDPGVTRYVDHPNVGKGTSKVIAPGQTIEVYFNWHVPSGISWVADEKPQVLFVQP